MIADFSKLLLGQGEEIGMLDYRHGISWKETQDPSACILGEQGKWREVSRDPVRK